MRNSVTIGSRGSKLALIQAEWVLVKLREYNPKLESSIIKIATTGDLEVSTALDKFSGQGIFVKELEKALLDNKIDIAVHSLKDMPTEIPHRLSLAAVTKRLDPRDVLVSRGRKLTELPTKAKIGTGSLRRAAQLLACRPDLEICQIRGNIDTRLRKVSQGEFDGIILAAAALIRLGWENKITEYLPVEHFTPSVGQGVLGIEIRVEDKAAASLISCINHEPTWQCIVAERTFLQTLGGGCRTPIAALGNISNSTLHLGGMVASTKTNHILYSSKEGNSLSSEQIGKSLAQELIEMGALQYIAET